MSDEKRDLSVTRNLTASAIEAMRPGEVLRDNLVPGLSVRCNATGRSFMLYYRTRGGDQRRPKVGEWGTVSIAQAREIARQWLAIVSSGGDPSAQHSADRASPTMDDLWARCQREHYCQGRQWDRDAKRLYTSNVAPVLGRKKVAAIDYADLQRLHGAMGTRPTEANRTLAVLAKMLRLAELWTYRPRGTNPSRDVKRYPERKRKRYARPDEIAAIGAALDKAARNPEHLSGAVFLYLMIFSGARPSEIQRATPDQLERIEMEGQVYGVLRLEKGKTGERTVHIPPQAMAHVDRLPPKREHLAGRKTIPYALWYAIRAEVGCEDLWVRDWRRTFATTGLSSGAFSLGQLGELLGHKSAQTTKVYAKLMEEPAMRATGAVANQMAAMLGSRHVAGDSDGGDTAGRRDVHRPDGVVDGAPVD